MKVFLILVVLPFICLVVFTSPFITSSAEDRARWAKVDAQAAARRELIARDPRAGKEDFACLALKRSVPLADFGDCAASYKGNGHYEAVGSNYFAGIDVDAEGHFQVSRLEHE